MFRSVGLLRKALLAAILLTAACGGGGNEGRFTEGKVANLMIRPDFVIATGDLKDRDLRHPGVEDLEIRMETFKASVDGIDATFDASIILGADTESTLWLDNPALQIRNRSGNPDFRHRFFFEDPSGVHATSVFFIKSSLVDGPGQQSGARLDLAGFSISDVDANRRRLEYAEFGRWMTILSDGVFTLHRAKAYFHFGLQTDPSQMPRNVSPTAPAAQYRGKIYGERSGQGEEIILGGDISISITLSEGLSTGVIDNIKEYDFFGKLLASRSEIYDLAGGIIPNTSRIDFATIKRRGTGQDVGDVFAQFYGPNAQEIAGTWTIDDPNTGFSGFGVFGSKLQP